MGGCKTKFNNTYTIQLNNRRPTIALEGVSCTEQMTLTSLLTSQKVISKVRHRY